MGIRTMDSTWMRMVMNFALAAFSVFSFNRMGLRMEIMFPIMHRSM